MFWFRKPPQQLPCITVGELRITFHPKATWWQFFYRETEFNAYGRAFMLPPLSELDDILRTTGELLSELRARLLAVSRAHALTDEAGELQLSIDLSSWAEERVFAITFVDGPQGVDLGGTFVIRSGQIVDEIWLD